MIESLFSLLVGILGHQLEGPTDRWIADPDLNRLAKYSEGIATLIAVYSLVIYHKVPREFRFVVIASLCLVALCLGIGVVIGYLLNGVRSKA